MWSSTAAECVGRPSPSTVCYLSSVLGSYKLIFPILGWHGHADLHWQEICILRTFFIYKNGNFGAGKKSRRLFKVGSLLYNLMNSVWSRFALTIITSCFSKSLAVGVCFLCPVWLYSLGDLVLCATMWQGYIAVNKKWTTAWNVCGGRRKHWKPLGWGAFCIDFWYWLSVHSLSSSAVFILFFFFCIIYLQLM